MDSTQDNLVTSSVPVSIGSSALDSDNKIIRSSVDRLYANSKDVISITTKLITDDGF
jgi:hypothetical protein